MDTIARKVALRIDDKRFEIIIYRPIQCDRCVQLRFSRLGHAAQIDEIASADPAVQQIVKAGKWNEILFRIFRY